MIFNVKSVFICIEKANMLSVNTLSCSVQCIVYFRCSTRGVCTFGIKEKTPPVLPTGFDITYQSCLFAYDIYRHHDFNTHREAFSRPGGEGP